MAGTQKWRFGTIIFNWVIFWSHVNFPECTPNRTRNNGYIIEKIAFCGVVVLMGVVGRAMIPSCQLVEHGTTSILGSIRMGLNETT